MWASSRAAGMERHAVRAGTPGSSQLDQIEEHPGRVSKHAHPAPRLILPVDRSLPNRVAPFSGRKQYLGVEPKTSEGLGLERPVGGRRAEQLEPALGVVQSPDGQEPDEGVVYEANVLSVECSLHSALGGPD